ncbi:MAG: SurA N-terminal domain-containing protein, partial [Gemmatimonadetes bacterium]|nr:SurA N-terminal domain-containing protein [Gemmatimonadota bacterium]
MMRQMRENTKWIMLVTAIAFVGLMVFEWGMDITGQSGGGLGEIGRVNGTPVTYDLYQATLRNLSDQLQATQAEPLTSQQYRDLEQAAWDEVVNLMLIEEELGRRGIVVTDDEVRQAARFSPPPELRQNPLFMVDGVFDLQAYQSFLSTSADEILLLQLEAYYRDIIPRGKLMRQVTSGIFPSDAELWSRYQDANEMVTVRYVALNPDTRIPDSAAEITVDELEDYYDAHRNDFQIPARAQVKAVLLSKTPTPADTAAALTRAQDIRQEIRDGADFGEVAGRESSDAASAAQGGDLGTFARGQMVQAFDSVVFNARIGGTSEPVQTQFGFHIVEV